MKLELTAYKHGQCVPSYHLQKKGMNYDGFNLGDQNNVPDVDLPSIYVTHKDTWSTSTVILSILSCTGVLPPWKGQQLLKTCHNSGFIFIQHTNILLNHYVMELPIEIFQQYPLQNGKYFGKYCNNTHYYYSMLRIIEDICKNFDYQQTSFFY